MNSQAITDTIVRELGGHRSPDEVARIICEQYGLGWGEAEELVRRVSFERRSAIAGRRSPMMLVLIIGGLIGGIGLLSRFLIALLVIGPRAALSLGLIMQAGSGLLMLIGALAGIFQLVRSFTR